MLFRSHIPEFPLSHFIESLYYFEGFTPEHSIDRFLPDGNVHIIIDLSETPKYIYDNDTLEERQACRNAWVSGIRTGYICIPSGLDAKNMIVNFRKGMSYPFFGMPVSELTNVVADAEQVFGRGILELRSELQETDSIEGKFALTERFLLNAAGRSPDDNPVIRHSLERLIHEPYGKSLKEISGDIGYSQKHFIQLFKDNVGVTPKTFLRIMRFQKAIEEIERIGNVSWIEIAVDCGYYDQSHFINDFKNFSGFTPEEYMVRKNGQVNYIPIR